MFRKNVTTLLIFCSNSGRNLHRVIGVSFGLLCVLQAALNICLRLIICESFYICAFSDRWFHFQKSLYYISSVKNTWHLSREYCLQEGADLAIINSRAEQVGDGVWIWEGGGRDVALGWNDLVCEFSNFYMCEKRIFP
uniref:C-type lectin domain-containing protein n=1 Tax=Takifugu rubripes TaxID=31033 RepID=A0A674M9X1_TAKRU